MYKLALILVFFNLAQAHYVKVILTDSIEVQDGNQLTIPFNKVLMEHNDKYDQGTHHVTVTQGRKYYIESHVEVQSDASTLVEVMQVRQGNEMVLRSCNIQHHNKCKFALRAVLENGDQIYVRVTPHTESGTTILKSDTYLMVAATHVSH